MPASIMRRRMRAGPSSGAPHDRRRLALAAAAVLAGLPLMLGALGFHVRDEFAQEHRARMDIRAAMRHRSALRDVFSGLLQAESGQRGYFLTGREAYLAPYLRARATLGAKTAALVAASRGAADRSEAAALQALADRKLAELDRTVTLARAGRQADALAVVRTDEGRRVMDQVRDMTAAGRNRDDAEIAARDLAADRAERATGDAALVAAAAMMLTLLSATGIVLASFRARRAALQASQASERRYRLVTEHAQDVIVQVDPEGRFEFVSPSSARVLGYQPEELLGRSLFGLVHPDDRPGLLAQQAAYVAAGPGAPGISALGRMIRKDGEVVWMSGRPKLVHGDDGRPLAAYDVLRDVTERRRMEEALEQARVKAQAAADAKSEFLANMSHELRTPLTAIIGYANLLAGDARLGGGAGQQVQRIRDASQALLSIVNDVLDVSRLDAGQAEIRRRPCELSELVEAVGAMVGGQARTKGLRLEVRTDTTARRVELDRDRVRQVLVNLLGNAIKFTDRGAVRLLARHGGGVLTVWVCDTGPGIAPEMVGRLFQRFSQVDGSSTRRHGGTGLGLAISKGLVEAMGGRIGVASRPGEGSIFWFELPAVASAGEARTAPEPPPPAADVAGARVLVVDDNMVNRELVAALLRPNGCEVATAEHAEAALEVAGSEAFDLVLIDRHMPGLSGLELARRLRRGGGSNASARLLAFSADVLAELEPEFDGELHKPINTYDLLAAVAQHRRDAVHRSGPPSRARA